MAQALTIQRDLAKLDPGSAEAQRDVLVALIKLAMLPAPGYSYAQALAQAGIKLEN